MARLLEERGELAEQVNHFEGTGVKRDKHGRPDKAKLAKEVQECKSCRLCGDLAPTDSLFMQAIAMNRRMFTLSVTMTKPSSGLALSDLE
jgi:formate hydrogenlyase subunit 6/NADH:ubiquinone oxidoreductase subunit I